MLGTQKKSKLPKLNSHKINKMPFKKRFTKKKRFAKKKRFTAKKRPQRKLN